MPSPTRAQPLFPTLEAAAEAVDDEQDTATEIQSLCMNCYKDGVTRLLLTRIPHYRDVVLMSFTCEECGFSNNEVQPGGAIADKGVRYTLHATEPADLDRQLVKSDYTSIRIHELDFEIPAQSQKGEVTTVEGVIQRAVAGLASDQPARHEIDPSAAAAIDDVIAKLKQLLQRDRPFTLTMEDISGNSWIENPAAPGADPRCRTVHFTRSAEQDRAVGVFSREEVARTTAEDSTGGEGEAGATGEAGSYERMARDEVLTFRTNCPECNAPADTNMKLTSIPYFKDVVIMATTCDVCGHRTNEVKSGGGIEERGVRYEVRVAGREDFSRDILKSETCAMSIPELDLEVGSAALGGRFTTAEGLIRSTLEQLAGAPELVGDSAPRDRALRTEHFLAKLEEVLCGTRTVTLVLDDPAGNSYVQSLAEHGPDPGLRITRYERTHEQNEELGLNDMKTEGYAQDDS